MLRGIIVFSLKRSDNSLMNDIVFLRKLELYKRDDNEVAEKSLGKCLFTTSMLFSEECAALSIFDERLDNDTRKNQNPEEMLKKSTLLSLKMYNIFTVKM